MENANAKPVCPYCEKEIENVKKIDRKREGKLSWAGVFYCCPECNKILSFGGPMG